MIKKVGGQWARSATNVIQERKGEGFLTSPFPLSDLTCRLPAFPIFPTDQKPGKAYKLSKWKNNTPGCCCMTKSFSLELVSHQMSSTLRQGMYKLEDQLSWFPWSFQSNGMTTSVQDLNLAILYFLSYDVNCRDVKDLCSMNTICSVILPKNYLLWTQVWDLRGKGACSAMHFTIAT